MVSKGGHHRSPPLLDLSTELAGPPAVLCGGRNIIPHPPVAEASDHRGARWQERSSLPCDDGLRAPGRCLVFEQLDPHPIGLDVRLQSERRLARVVVARGLSVVHREVVHAKVARDLKFCG